MHVVLGKGAAADADRVRLDAEAAKARALVQALRVCVARGDGEDERAEAFGARVRDQRLTSARPTPCPALSGATYMPTTVALCRAFARASRSSPTMPTSSARS